MLMKPNNTTMKQKEYVEIESRLVLTSYYSVDRGENASVSTDQLDNNCST